MLGFLVVAASLTVISRLLVERVTVTPFVS